MPRECAKCRGHGGYYDKTFYGGGRQLTWVKCEACGGKGSVPKEKPENA